MDLMLGGKVAIVTGGNKGIGRGVSDALVDEGCHLCICSRHEDEVRQAAEKLEERGRGTASGSWRSWRISRKKQTGKNS